MNKTTETSFCSRPAALFACGRQSIRLPVPVYIRSSASVVGSREKQGPLGELFDFAGEDDLFGCDTWEDAESSLQRDALHLALQKAGLHSTDIRYLFAGDLLGQSIATSFGLMQYERPLFGLYGACSTCGLSLTLASLAVSGSFADFAACVTSSHFASAEKEFRFPLGYGNQRPLSASWTVTGSGAFILANAPSGHDRAMITGLTPGKIVDYGLRDSMNMGACMAPAAADTIRQHFEDFGTAPKDYDKIVTGDLGKVGQRVLLDLLQTSGIDLGERHMDCGIEIYDCKKQDTHAGGSGCGCSASVLSAFLLKQLSEKKVEADSIRPHRRAAFQNELQRGTERPRHRPRAPAGSNLSVARVRILSGAFLFHRTHFPMKKKKASARSTILQAGAFSSYFSTLKPAFFTMLRIPASKCLACSSAVRFLKPEQRPSWRSSFCPSCPCRGRQR